MKMNCKAHALTLLVAAAPGIRAAADETLVRRIEALEARVAQTESGGAPSRIHIHGYGEMHYNRWSGRGGAPDHREIDYHRFVLFFGHDFSDRIRFQSEVEIEHTLIGDGKPGYLQLEQAYLEIDVADRHSVRAGLFILPLGLLNRVHEPPHFYGVERNRIENRIIPTTWFEGGLGMVGELAQGWTYEAYLHTGIRADADLNYGIRAGRQKVAHADASNPAATAALAWSVPGLTIGGSVHVQDDITQGNDPDAGAARLGEVHVDATRGPLSARALYAEWKLDGAGPRAVGADRQFGWYVELSYRPIPAFGLFARHGQWDEQAGDSSSRSAKTQWDFGFNAWVHERVVFKADYQVQDNRNGRNQNGFNLGLGYEF